MKRKLLTLLALMMPVAAMADDKLSSGDTSWMIVATALVMLMTPAGLALFYGGLTRKKNVLNTIGMSLIAYAIGTLVWVIAGYSIAFGVGLSACFLYWASTKVAIYIGGLGVFLMRTLYF